MGVGGLCGVVNNQKEKGKKSPSKEKNLHNYHGHMIVVLFKGLKS